MAAHTPTQRQFIIRKLAAHYTLIEIVAQFKANWTDTDCTDSDVMACDPRAASVPNFDEWTLFQTERAAELAELERLWPGMSETQQKLLRTLTRDYETQRNRNAFDLANKTAAEIAKIEGGFYAGKGKAEAPAQGVEEITALTRTVIYPKGHNGADSGHTDTGSVPAAPAPETV